MDHAKMLRSFSALCWIAVRCGAERQRGGGHGRRRAPHGRLELSGKVEYDSESASGQAYGALVPGAPLGVGDGVAVLELGGIAWVEGVSAMLIFEGERVLPVELVRAFGIPRETVHRDADQVARDRVGAVRVAVVDEL